VARGEAPARHSSGPQLPSSRRDLRIQLRAAHGLGLIHQAQAAQGQGQRRRRGSGGRCAHFTAEVIEQRREREGGGGAEAVARQAERGEATRPLLRDTIAQQRARLRVHRVCDK